MSDVKNWQLNTHRIHTLQADEAGEMLSYLSELDAELQGAIRSLRLRISALKDMENAELRVKLAQLKGGA